MMRKTRDQWLGQLVDELKIQAQKSFQVGSFEKISNPAVNEKAPELMETLNNLLNCANLLLNHARENMTMLNRINHSGMWSMYFGNDSQVNRVAFSDEFREIIGYTDNVEFSDSVDAWTAKIYEGDRKRVIQEFQDTIKDSTQQKNLIQNIVSRPSIMVCAGCVWLEKLFGEGKNLLNLLALLRISPQPTTMPGS